MPTELDIFIEPNCDNCRRGLEIAADVRRRLPDVEVRVIDITDPGSDPPDRVFAVPTYLIDGRIYSLGNPDLERLLTELESTQGRTRHN